MPSMDLKWLACNLLSYYIDEPHHDTSGQYPLVDQQMWDELMCMPYAGKGSACARSSADRCMEEAVRIADLMSDLDVRTLAPHLWSHEVGRPIEEYYSMEPVSCECLDCDWCISKAAMHKASWIYAMYRHTFCDRVRSLSEYGLVVKESFPVRVFKPAICHDYLITTTHNYFVGEGATYISAFQALEASIVDTWHLYKSTRDLAGYISHPHIHFLKAHIDE